MKKADESSATRPLKFYWWCRECGWWCEVDLSGLCSDCRSESDSNHRGATPDDVERLAQCGRCSR